MKVDISLDIEINASQKEVFDSFVNWETQGEWMFGTKVYRTKNNGEGIGGEIVAWTGFWKIGFNDPMVITKWEAPRIVDMKHLGKVVKGTGSMIAEKISDNRTKFIWSETIELPFSIFGRIGWFFIKPFFVIAIKHSLKKFALTFAQKGSI